MSLDEPESEPAFATVNVDVSREIRIPTDLLGDDPSDEDLRERAEDWFWNWPSESLANEPGPSEDDIQVAGVTLPTEDGFERDQVPDADRYGPFHYTGPEGFEAWGYRFPSDFLILEWIPESVPDSEDKIHGGHQSIYHSFEEFRTICTGEIDWGQTPDSERDAQ